MAALEESIKLQAAIVELAPKSWEMRASLANLYYYGGDDANAEIHARHSVLLNAGIATTQKLLGRILVQVGLSQKGLPHLQEALALAPHDGECWYKVGTVYFEQGLMQRAITCFRAAGALRNDSLSWLSAAHTLHKLKKVCAHHNLPPHTALTPKTHPSLQNTPEPPNIQDQQSQGGGKFAREFWVLLPRG